MSNIHHNEEMQVMILDHVFNLFVLKVILLVEVLICMRGQNSVFTTLLIMKENMLKTV